MADTRMVSHKSVLHPAQILEVLTELLTGRAAASEGYRGVHNPKQHERCPGSFAPHRHPRQDVLSFGRAVETDDDRRDRLGSERRPPDACSGARSAPPHGGCVRRPTGPYDR